MYNMKNKVNPNMDDYTDLHNFAVPLVNGIKIQEFIVNRRL